MKIGYRIRDNRDMYWRWFQHSHKYHWGVWGGIDDATIVYDEKSLKAMIRDVFKTIRKSDNLLAQATMVTGIVAERAQIVEDIQGELNVEVTMHGDQLYWDSQKFSKEFKRSTK